MMAQLNLPPLSAVIEPEDEMFVARCPELGIASQGSSVDDARAMLQEAVELWLEVADDAEVGRRLAERGYVFPLALAA